MEATMVKKAKKKTTAKRSAGKTRTKNMPAAVMTLTAPPAAALAATLPKPNVVNLVPVGITPTPPKLGTPNVALFLTFAQMKELEDKITVVHEATGQLLDWLASKLGKLTRQQIRCLDIMRKIWPPDGKPPPEYRKVGPCLKQVRTWCKKHDERSPERDVLSDTVQERHLFD
jgi:hypothetical protein